MFKSAKEIAYVGITVALLIGGQLAFSAISGVEIVTAIFAVFCLVLGAVRGVVVAIAFSLVRCFVFGFFPQVILLYLVYYNLFAIVVGLLGVAIRGKRELVKIVLLTCVVVVLTGCFTFIDNFFNIWLLKLPPVAVKIYVAQSIPVAISQMVCACVTVPLFYYPLNKVFTIARQSL
ncbi:MAG: hypothetical protein IKA99_03455 [Clostridia bacterium]|nr:hypothetical protein [Clostridia bacterium]